jgi:hypothetical protein
LNHEYIQALQNRKQELLKALKCAEADLKHAPEGRIRASQNGNGFQQFYHVTSKTGFSGKYMNAKSKPLVTALIQKEYDGVFLQRARKEIELIDNLIEFQSKELAEKSEEELHKSKRKYISPYILDEKSYAESWENESFIASTYKPEEKIYPTNKGDMVRSKSEELLADMYYDLGIPYRYECKLVLKDGRAKYPDFTLLDVKRRRVIYHEHLGILEDDEYRAKNLIKLNDYSKSGIYFGKNLLMTFETEYCPLNIKDIRENVMEMFVL